MVPTHGGKGANECTTRQDHPDGERRLPGGEAARTRSPPSDARTYRHIASGALVEAVRSRAYGDVVEGRQGASEFHADLLAYDQFISGNYDTSVVTGLRP